MIVHDVATLCPVNIVQGLDELEDYAGKKQPVTIGAHPRPDRSSKGSGRLKMFEWSLGVTGQPLAARDSIGGQAAPRALARHNAALSDGRDWKRWQYEGLFRTSCWSHAR